MYRKNSFNYAPLIISACQGLDILWIDLNYSRYSYIGKTFCGNDLSNYPRSLRIKKQSPRIFEHSTVIF